jgi:predicted kinase
MASLRLTPAWLRTANNPENSQSLSADGEGRAAAEERSASVLVLLVGLPGSGKSTFARRLAPLIDAVILESDVMRRLLFESPQHGDSESNRLFRAIQAVTLRLLIDHRSVIVDATNLREKHRKPFRDIAATTGARLQVVHVTAPEDVIFERLAGRRDAPDPLDASRAYEGVYALLEQQEEAPRGAHLRIDTSDPVAIDATLRTLVDEARPLSVAGRGGIS